MASDSGYMIQSTVTSFRIVETLKGLDGAGVTEIASRVGISKGSAYKHLYTLRQLGCVAKEGGTYRLDVPLRDVDTSPFEDRDIVDIAHPRITELADVTGELVELLIEVDGRGEYVLGQSGDDYEDSPPTEGPVPLLDTAAGLAYVSQLPEERAAEIVEGDSETAARDELRSRLRQARELGVVTVVSETSDGSNQVAVPICAEDGSPMAAISVSGPRDRLRGRRLKEHVSGLLKAEASAIEKKLRK